MGRGRLLPCRVFYLTNLNECLCRQCDILCIIDANDSQITCNECLVSKFEELRSLDCAFDSLVSFIVVPNLNLPVIYSPVGVITDYDDIRVYQRAAAKALDRAIKAGYKSPVLVIPSKTKFGNSELCIMLGALHELYVPIQLREDCPEKKERITCLTFLISHENAKQIFQEALRIESARFIARDIGGADPERMAACGVEEYVRCYLRGLKMTVISDYETLMCEYPLFAAVERAAQTVERHRGRIIFLEWHCRQAKKSYLLVGKGVTFDTGGADVKYGGGMSGWSRDKCGAAAVAGIMRVVQQLKPKNCNVIGALCMVRNSIGEESYVADEIITSRAGIRVRVGHTDAEGRMAMADPLCRMKELAMDLPDPHIFTLATLTGHAISTVGYGYSIIVENSVSRKCKYAQRLKIVGDQFGDPCEVSTLRPEDFEMNAGQVIGEDLVQYSQPTAKDTPRGHQFPVAFLMVASGLDKHGLCSKKPIKYTHFDIAPSAREYPLMPTGSPIVVLTKTLFCQSQNE